jgi:hypothetical protein
MSFKNRVNEIINIRSTYINNALKKTKIRVIMNNKGTNMDITKDYIGMSFNRNFYEKK